MLFVALFSNAMILVSCGNSTSNSNSGSNAGIQSNAKTITLSSGNFGSYAHLEASVYKLDRNTVYLENYLYFSPSVKNYSNLHVSLQVTYTIRYRLSNGSVGTDSRMAMAKFDNNQKNINSVYFSLPYSIVEINYVSIRYNIFSASGNLILS